MESASLRRIFAICFALAALFLAAAPALAENGPKELAGSGYATAAPFIAYVGHDGVVRQAPSIEAVGHQISFSFFARRDKEGRVQGEMQMVDHTAGIVIHSDVAELVTHPTHNRPVGSAGSTVLRIRSSTDAVVVDGVSRPGWRFENTPVSDGAAAGTADTICFELIDKEGRQVLQWSAFVSSGDVVVR